MKTKTQRSLFRILVVEDDALVRMNGVDFLEDAGFTVVEAESADEAIEILNSAHEVQLLFTDVDMLGSINGLQLAELVHRRWPKIRLLVTSGHHHFPDSELPDSGRFVAKPYTGANIVAQADELLNAG